MKITRTQKQKKSTNKNDEKSYTDPITGKFKEGNPGGGRPEGTKNFSTLMDEAVEEIAKANNISKSEVWQILIKRGYSEAKDGNYPFYKDLLDRYFGKAQDKIDITSLGEKITPIYGGKSIETNELPKV
jgi:hypothetical protein